ncbi:MAG TPA: hypothetical protein VHM89_05360 [Acidimicrobiales bacterium]|nr:hypothetical protein [Acidimicrobiales bacterium]
MRRSRWAARAAFVATTVSLSVLPAVTSVPPAGANHLLLTALQVTPEVSSVQVGTSVNLTAHLRNTLLAGELGATSATKINFHFEGGPLGGTPDQSCTIAQLSTTCVLPVSANASGTTLVRTSIDGGTVDAAEGRLASTAPESTTAADCLSESDGEVAAATCRSNDTLAPGTIAEPDDTDVVKVTWRDRGLDVSPDNQAKALGETASLTATAYNLDGTPAANVVVKFEFFDSSVSDPAGGSTPASPDRMCTTGANGTCTLPVVQTADGTDLLCAWTTTTPPAMQGKAGDTGSCASEVLVDLSGNDGTPSPIDDAIDVVRILWGTANLATTTTTLPGGTTPVPGSGYWMVASDGGIFAFGDAVFQGSTGAIKLNQPIVGMAATPTRKGYLLVASDGGIFAFGDAVFRGSTGAIKLNQPIVGMAATPNGGGYFLVAKDGGIFAFGNAVFRGSTGAIKLAQPIVGMDVTPSGNGYFLVAADGGVFAFGDAVFRGSTGGIKLAKPIVGMTTTPSGNGYYLVAADGGIFAFGDAVFRGSTGAIKLNQPIVGMSRSASGAGYRLVAADGGIFAFGDALFKGSTGAIKLNKPMVGMSGF